MVLHERKAEAMRAVTQAYQQMHARTAVPPRPICALVLEADLPRGQLEERILRMRSPSAGEGGNRGAARAQGGGDARRHSGAAPRAGRHLHGLTHGRAANAACPLG